MNFRQQLLSNLGRGAAFEEHTQAACSIGDSPLRLIAFYLPQYHPIPQNDLWWGRGFTEWTNVTKALPRFGRRRGQPSWRGELEITDVQNFYLAVPRAVWRAREHGIGGNRTN